MVTHVGDSTYITGTTAALTNSYSSTTGNTLVAYIDGYVTGNTPISVSSVTDTADNTWTVINGASSYNGSYYACCAVAFCVDAAAVTSVTANFSTAPTDIGYLQVSEFSGVAAGRIASAGCRAESGSVTLFTTRRLSWHSPRLSLSAHGGGWFLVRGHARNTAI